LIERRHYRVLGQRTIEIVRILHDSMDVGEHVPGDLGLAGSPPIGRTRDLLI
jgi:hypothetical protein